MKRLPLHGVPFDGVDLSSVSVWRAPTRQPRCAQPLTLSSGLDRLRVLHVSPTPHAALAPGFVPCVVSICLSRAHVTCPHCGLAHGKCFQ